MRIIADENSAGKEGGQAGFWGRCKAQLRRIPPDAYIAAIVILASCASFGFGYLAGRDAGAKTNFSIEQLPLREGELSTTPLVSEDSKTAEPAPQGGQYVASRSGSKYHLPWCSGAKNISEANKIWFASKEEAEAKGYTAAANCPGL